MTHPFNRALSAVLAAGLAMLAGAAPAAARIVSKTEQIAGTTMHYKVVLPEGYDASAEYPAVLAFPGGGQTMGIADGMIARNLKPEADKRGYIVVMLTAPAEGLLFQGGARIFPEMLDKLLADYKIRDRKFHAAGISNGGLSAFHVAASYPSYFWSVTGFPGYLQDATEARVNALKDMCINMYVGENDRGWLQAMQAQSNQFKKAGMTATFTIEPGQGHVMTSLQGDGAARIFDRFDQARQGCAK